MTQTTRARGGFLGRLLGGADKSVPAPSVAQKRMATIATRLDRPLTVLDVGCRWGFADMWSALSPHVHLYGFDPDKEECARLEAMYAGQNVRFAPVALADAAGRRTLHITRDPACSSLYPPDPVFTRTMPQLECAAPSRTVEIDVRTLDDWAAEAKPGPIDFIKLDTQGSELDILHGAGQSLADVRALEVEVEFNPIYVGQPLFGDVDRFLRDKGFVLWKLSTFAHYTRGAPDDAEQGQDLFFYDTKGVHRPMHGGQLMWGHAYFVRPDMAAAGTDQGSTGPQAVRDAALAATLGFGDLADKLLSAGHRGDRDDQHHPRPDRPGL